MGKLIAASIPFIQALLYIWKELKVFVSSSKGSIPVLKQPFGDRLIHGFAMNYICAMDLVSSLENELAGGQRLAFTRR